MLSEAQLTAPASNGSALPEPPGESSNSVLYVSGAVLPTALGLVSMLPSPPRLSDQSVLVGRQAKKAWSRSGAGRSAWGSWATPASTCTAPLDSRQACQQ